MGSDVFAADYKTTPYWQDIAPKVSLPKQELPDEIEVLIIGAGYTGLNAALQTASDGLGTLVIDAEHPGWGCSLRNGGQLSTSLKPSFSALSGRYGDELATALCQEGQASLDYMHQLSADGLDMGLKEVGRFHGAHKPHLYDKLAKEAETGHPVWKPDAFMVSKEDMASELRTEAYHGGIVFPHHCSADVSKYHPALLKRVLETGAHVIGNCRALSLDRTGSGFKILTDRGEIRAGKVILATNGYSGPLSPWHQRRVIPIGSYVIATEELPTDLVDRLFPTDRILSDTRKLVYYYRLSPDRKRVLFGGRVSLSETDPRNSAVKLHQEMCALFPELRPFKVSHGWMGFVGYTFDTLAHCGEDKGLFYANGYCGSGVGMASYLGMRIGRKAAGRETTPSAFEMIPNPTRPFYTGNPWFLAPSVMVYRIRDRLGL
ncbi:NAD(P)/FAD-dependent oxidoreductase [Roseibium alexandrii]|uniref:Glycine/D-amino acid oxidase (Deaminating) n=1 Tax=Roseibium alexandrii (strain DSM 17067 / NCIMB 14079 / DFL-11) TaxID=244592 RepID=A0A5E8GYM3_ROSAD|nr:FAD-binding oxidoreductase [Roseibium alexandrii]EEE44562.1 Glycine/D-amino acid oxidase (deaminating) [Roseibium alexandrii DFL-11]